MTNYFEKNDIIPNRLNDTNAEIKDLKKSQIISCSRRTDIPAFLMDWLIEKMKKGYVEVQNPFNKKQISKVSLRSDDVLCWVWWSKNFRPWIKNYLENQEVFDKYKVHVFNFTINSPSELEPGLNISLDERFKQLKWLIKNFGIKSIQVRYDPIVFYKTSPNYNEIKDNLSKYDLIMKKISEMGIKDIIFSFATVYKKVQKRMKYRNKILLDLSSSKKKEILDNSIIPINKKYDIQLHACCQPDLIGYKEIKQAHCIDGDKIQELLGKDRQIIVKTDNGQRNSCGCTKSRDIGGYYGFFKCKHNCDYCYANTSKK